MVVGLIKELMSDAYIYILNGVYPIWSNNGVDIQSIVLCQHLSLILAYSHPLLHSFTKSMIHCVAKVYAVLPFYDVKCLCSGGRE